MPEPFRPGSHPVVVIGGGWAGLAAAVELCSAGVPTTLIESTRQPGGRARSIRFGTRIVDNGQHLLTGAYQTLLMLMERVGVDIDTALLRIPFCFNLRNGVCDSLVLQAPELPAPLHLIAALMRAQGPGVRDRIQALRFGRHLLRASLSADRDISVQALLHSSRQTPLMISRLWNPLCISALNTPPEEASARLFLNVLRETFQRPGAHSDLLIPRQELGKLFPQPAMEFIEQRGAQVLLGQRVTGVTVHANRVSAVCTSERSIAGSHVILATPHHVARQLMSPYPQLQTICNDLAGLGHEPVSTLYLEYPPDIRPEQPLVCLEGGTAQWIFDRSVCNQPGLMAAVISARGPHTDWNREQLTARVVAEIACCYPDWPKPVNSLLVREKRATFTARAGIDLLRPANRTPVQGLWLAGDYTDNDLPATLEAAVRSGSNCARQLLSSLAKNQSNGIVTT